MLTVHRYNVIFPTKRLKINQSKIVYTGYNAIFRGSGKTENQPVKTGINSTPGTMKGRTGNYLVKNTINGTQGTLLYTRERGRLKITL